MPERAEPSVRLAVPGDLAAVQGIVAAAYGPYEAEIGVRPGPLDDDYAQYIDRGWTHVLEDGGILGLLVLIPQQDALLLDNVALAPHAQGQGHGGRLMRFAEAFARAGGFDRIRLYTHEKMSANRALYAGLGYVETGRKTERGLARVYFEKTL